jgi:hypothetical protein
MPFQKVRHAITPVSDIDHFSYSSFFGLTCVFTQANIRQSVCIDTQRGSDG